MSDDKLKDFTFDVNLNGTVVVRAADLPAAMRFLRTVVYGYENVATLRGEGGVADINVLSFGTMDPRRYQGRDMVLQHIEASDIHDAGRGIAYGIGRNLTNADSATLCTAYERGEPRAGCRVVHEQVPGPCLVCGAPE